MKSNPPIILKTLIEIKCERKTASKFPFWQDLKIGDHLELSVDCTEWWLNFKLKNIRNNLEFTTDSYRTLMNQLKNWDYVNV